jgi:hypothetical protein
MSGGSGAKFGAKNQKKALSAHKKVVDLDVFPTAEELFKEEEIFFTDFMRDDEYDDDGVLVSEAPKVYEMGGHLPDLRLRVETFVVRHNEQVCFRFLCSLLMPYWMNLCVLRRIYRHMKPFFIVIF